MQVESSCFISCGVQVGEWYCWWKKSCTSWWVVYPIFYRVSYVSGGAGFQPSTVQPIFHLKFWRSGIRSHVRSHQLSAEWQLGWAEYRISTGGKRQKDNNIEKQQQKQTGQKESNRYKRDKNSKKQLFCTDFSASQIWMFPKIVVPPNHPF